MAKRLKEPLGLDIEFKPSYKQYIAWQMLQPNRCDYCGGTLKMKASGVDKNGNKIYSPVCSKCGTDDIPSMVLFAGAAGAGKTLLGCSWVVAMCLKFPNMRGVLARKTLKVLKATTWVTLMKVLDMFGLKQDENYYIDNINTVLHFWNGSSILALSLAPSLQDPEYNFLGSLEISFFYCDEVSEVTEKAIEVLRSRCRWNTADTFVVPKALLGTNPTDNWVRGAFVQDEDGNPIKPAKGLRYVPATVYDNPDPVFRAAYINNLMKIRDPFTRRRLLAGDWSSPNANNMAAYWNFDGTKHLVRHLCQKRYDPTKTIILAMDFNVNPAMHAEVFQIFYEEKKLCVLWEYVGKPDDKRNNTPAFSRYIAQDLIERGHIGGIILTGDPAGAARSTQTEDGVNNYTIAKDNLSLHHLSPSIQLMQTQPSQKGRLEFVNELFNGYEGWTVEADLKCVKLTQDFVGQHKTQDGGKEKKKVLLENGTRAEQYGHASDCFDYVAVQFLSKEYQRFVTGQSNPTIITVDASQVVYNEFDY